MRQRDPTMITFYMQACIRHRNAKVDWIRRISSEFFFLIFVSFQLLVTDYIVWHFMEHCNTAAL